MQKKRRYSTHVRCNKPCIINLLWKIDTLKLSRWILSKYFNNKRLYVFVAFRTGCFGDFHYVNPLHPPANESRPELLRTTARQISSLNC